MKGRIAGSGVLNLMVGLCLSVFFFAGGWNETSGRIVRVDAVYPVFRGFVLFGCDVGNGR